MTAIRKFWSWLKVGKRWLILPAVVAGLLALVRLGKPRTVRDSGGPDLTPDEADKERERIDAEAETEHDRIAAKALADRERIKRAQERFKNDKS